MNLRGVLTALLILCASALPAVAQAPASATTAFDGRYVGTATLAYDIYGVCSPISSMDMTITGGQVIIHEVRFNGHPATFRGSVNPAGDVSTYRENRTLDGAIHNKVFTGQHLIGKYCHYSVQMALAIAPTGPFDGWYDGVSRELSDSRHDESRCSPRALTPPAPLKIANGAIGSPGTGWWEGIVTPQGAVVIRNPKFSRVDAQIDPQGTIRGQYRGKLPSDLEAVGGTNCIVKFVWQKE